MATISGLITSYAVHPKLPLNNQRYKINGIPLAFKRINRIQRCFGADSSTRHVHSLGRERDGLVFHDNVFGDPFWLAGIKEFMGGLKSLLMSLAQQPGQLKYLEWPSFPSTLKTATLTHVVALLIVALSSVDAGLSSVGFATTGTHVIYRLLLK